MQFHSEVERIQQVRDEMAGSPLYSATKRADVVERENCIIAGKGIVYGDHYDLRAYAILSQ
jgi:hypothetical protein